MAKRKPFTMWDLERGKVEEYSDSSRLEKATATATSKRAEYVGMHVTVTDAGMSGI